MKDILIVQYNKEGSCCWENDQAYYNYIDAEKRYTLIKSGKVYNFKISGIRILTIWLFSEE